MNNVFYRFVAVSMALSLFGCSSMMGNEVSIHEAQRSKEAAATPKYAATMRIAGYTDGRNTGDARKVGIANVRVSGMSGTDIRLDRDVNEVVAESMYSRLDEAGFLVLEPDDPTAMFELSGVVKELSFDAKERDYVSVKVESTLKEIASGKVVWSGEAAQASDRFAGVSGNTKDDIANYLQHELSVTTGKTVESIKSVLLATRSDLFGLPAGAKAIEGVSVFVSQNSGLSAPTNTAVRPVPNPLPGTLVVRTEPTRAKVYLDDVYYGLSPLTIQSAAGIHKIEVKLKGHRTAREKVAVRVGASTDVEFQLEK